jgi:phosphopantetheine--protein transferase-like protein
MDIMRSAAALVDPAAEQAAFEDIRFLSPVKVFGETPFEAEVEVVRDRAEGPPAFSARTFSWHFDKQGRRIGAARVHHRLRLTTVTAAADPAPDSVDWKSSVWIPHEDLYSVFFHGPSFKFLDRVIMDPDGKEVRFTLRDLVCAGELFKTWLPAAVEAVLQAAAALGVESHGIMALPIALERVAVHRPEAAPASGRLTLVRESLWEAAEGRKVLTFDGAVYDRQGQAILTLKGVEMAERDVSRGFTGRVVEDVQSVDEVAKRMEEAPETYLKSTLTADEVEEFKAKAVPKRAGEWIAGRVALKRSVQRLLVISGGEAPPLNSISIVADEYGKPTAAPVGGAGRPFGLVSLSHSNGLALAAAANADKFEGLGVDIEKVESRSEAWVKDCFTDNEIQAAEKADDRSLELTGIWSLKEAALKALGAGLRFDLKDINAERVDAGGRAILEFRNEAARYLEQNSTGPIEATVEARADMVIARALIRKA